MDEKPKRGRPRKNHPKPLQDSWMVKGANYAEKYRSTYISKDWCTYKFVTADNIQRNKKAGWQTIDFQTMKKEMIVDLNGLESLGRDYDKLPGHTKRKYETCSQTRSYYIKKAENDEF